MVTDISSFEHKPSLKATALVASQQDKAAQEMTYPSDIEAIVLVSALMVVGAIGAALKQKRGN